MDFTVSEEIQILQQTLRRFVTDEVIPLEKKHALSWDVAPPKELRQHVRLRSKALGLYGLDMPREMGGAGISLSDRCLLEMEVHFHDTVFFEDVLGGGGGPTPVLLACTDEQKEKYLHPLMSGEVTTCFALSEPDAGSDATALRTRAERKDGVFVLNGTKNIISNGVQADFAMTFAVTDQTLGPAGGITCFLVDKDAPGFSVGRSHTCMAFTGFQGELVFDNCEVPAANVLGQEGYGLMLALDWINANRVRTAAMAVGITRRLLKMSAEYAKQRRQFGNAIATYQAIQWKLADMATELFAAENMIYRTAWMRDQGMDIRKEAAMTKLYCSELVNRAAYEAIQIHGGIGCLKETNVERVYRMVRILTILEGTSEMQRLTIARRLLKDDRW
ncbi:MAG: acyl-CoA dehydrogenase family protein [Candidatus Binatia bacterium]